LRVLTEEGICQDIESYTVKIGNTSHTQPEDFYVTSNPMNNSTRVSMSITSAQRKDFMDTLRKYMYDDIEQAIKARANYLAAFGLSAYTEHLGGYLGDLGPRNSNKNYTEFIKVSFPTAYGIVNLQLQGHG
jgi:hypothetical protein